MKLRLFQINTFTEQFNGGNPAGVIPLNKWLADEVMQAIATENGFSETAFYVPVGDAFELRWFTPGCEVDLCGHATLASVFVIANELHVTRDRYVFHTRSGELPVWPPNGQRSTNMGFTMDFPANELQPVNDFETLVSALRLPPATTPLNCYRADDYLLVLNTEAEVASLQPDFAALRRMDARGLIVTAASTRKGIDFVSRWFGGPDVGIDEDPVTGSAHCSLIPYWAKQLQKERFEAEQISTRKGYLSCRQLDDRVHITGKAVTYFQGEITGPFG